MTFEESKFPALQQQERASDLGHMDSSNALPSLVGFTSESRIWAGHCVAYTIKTGLNEK